MIWALLVSILASPAGAAGATQGWRTLAAAESRRRWAWAVALAAAFGYAAVHVLMADTMEIITLERFTAGTSATPFQYRALVPWAATAVTHLPGLSTVSLPALYVTLDSASAFAVWLAFRRFLRPWIAGTSERSVAALAVFVPLFLGTAAPWRHNAFYFPADTLSVAAFALGLALLQERRWIPYYLLFVVATFNRETTCFLTIAWVLAEWGRRPLVALAVHSVAQLGLWLGVKASLAALYAGNPVLHGGSNSLFIDTTKRTVFTLVAVPGWVYFGLAMGGLWVVLVPLRHRLRAPELRRWFRVVPVFLLGMALVGDLLEVRIYSELAPLVMAGLVLVLGDIVTKNAIISPYNITRSRSDRIPLRYRNVVRPQKYQPYRHEIGNVIQHRCQ